MLTRWRSNNQPRIVPIQLPFKLHRKLVLITRILCRLFKGYEVRHCIVLGLGLGAESFYLGLKVFGKGFCLGAGKSCHPSVVLCV